ncbi:MAG: DUF4279 domain-containing protein [Vulcanimicrobiota bacterium]
MTPINSDYQTCARTSASLSVFTGDENAEVVTEILGVEPTRVVVKGREVTNNSGFTKVEPNNIWKLESENFISSKDLREHLDWLLGRLLPVREKFAALHEREGYKMRVSCSWWSKHGGGGPAIWPEQMMGLAQLNLELNLGFAYYDDDDDE